MAAYPRPGASTLMLTAIGGADTVEAGGRPPCASAIFAQLTRRQGPRVPHTKGRSMDFSMSAKAQDYLQRLSEFMVEHVLPAEAEYRRYRVEVGPADHTVPPIVEELKLLAKNRGLWDLFLPTISGLTNLEYAPLAEKSGWSIDVAPEALNYAAPDTGDIETLHLFATPEQRAQWLEPLLAGKIRSGFAMTEPAVASSDARNIETTIAQARLGPGRIHHCLRAVGAAERALMMLVDRATKRMPFGKPLSDQGVVRESIAESRNEIDQVRLLGEKAAWAIDTLSRLRSWHRAMRLFDGPDEVHMRTIARAEIQRPRSALAEAVQS
jgi:alkylation response protein AidB-like acyl-CoA dehydrogenase